MTFIQGTSLTFILIFLTSCRLEEKESVNLDFLNITSDVEEIVSQSASKIKLDDLRLEHQASEVKLVKPYTSDEKLMKVFGSEWEKVKPFDMLYRENCFLIVFLSIEKQITAIAEVDRRKFKLEEGDKYLSLR